MTVRLPIRAGTSSRVRWTTGDRAVGTVGDRVEARHVDAVDAGQPGEQLDTAAGAALLLPRPDDVGDVADHLLAVAQDGAVDEVG